MCVDEDGRCAELSTVRVGEAMAEVIDDGRRSFELARGCSKWASGSSEKMWAKAIEGRRGMAREFEDFVRNGNGEWL